MLLFALLSLPVFSSYLLGSIPFGLVLTKTFSKTDLTKIGSGNIGATNVLRTGSKKLAIATLILDFLKGFASVATLSLFMLYFTKTDNSHLGEAFLNVTFSEFTDKYAHLYLCVGFFAIIGHCFPVWLKFKGGKGVATTFGVLFAAVPWAGFIAAVTWGIVAGFSRYSSLSALSAVAITPLVTFIYYGPMPAVITVLIAALVFWRHKDNIKRLMAGTESKIGTKKDSMKAQDAPEPKTE